MVTKNLSIKKFWLGIVAALLAVAGHAYAQSSQHPLAQPDAPKIEVYPRYPVSANPATGPGPFIHDSDRASVSVVVYAWGCPAQIPDYHVVPRPVVTMVGNRFNVLPVYTSGPCGLGVGTTEGPVVFSVYLEDLGPGTYQVAVNPDAPPSTLVRDFVVLSLQQANSALLEIPAPGSTQSGIGLISGWACISDQVEVSIDDGPRQRLQGEMPRADVDSVCSHHTAGFGQLFNFNTLGPGTHTMQIYVKGVAMGTPSQFNVVTPAGEFLSGIQREVSVTNFPAEGKTTVLDWRQSEQNFGIKEVK